MNDIVHQGDGEFFLALPFQFYDWDFSILFQTSHFQKETINYSASIII